MATLNQIQQQLVNRGFGPLTVDGVKGPATTEALKKFQAANGLTADGIAGPKTIEKLFAISPAPAPVDKPAYIDNVTLQRINQLHPKVRQDALAVYKEAAEALNGRASLRFVFTIRTFAEQQALYNQGRTTPGKIVTNAGPLSSYHNFALAIDFVLLVDKNGNGKYDEISWDTIGDYDGDRVSDWMEVVRIFKAHGWEWGGDWITLKDFPHFQKTFGYSVSQLRDKYLKKNFILGTTYVNI